MSIAIACKDIQFPSIAAIIFDKDGTLEDSQAFWHQLGIKRVSLIETRISGIKESLLRVFGIDNNTFNSTGLMAVGSSEENLIAAAAYIAETGISWSEAKHIARDAFAEAARYLSKTPESAPLFPETRETIISLANAGLKLGIISADSTPGVESFVVDHHLEEYIQLTMGTDRGIYKPDPRLFIEACQILNVKPSETLMVGDSQVDIDMAVSAGAAATIGICRNSNTIPVASADIILTDLSEIEILNPQT